MAHFQSFKRLSLALLAFILFANLRCPQGSDGEPLNRIELHLTATDGSTFDQTFVAHDTDGDWFLDSIQTLSLPANTTFNCAISIFKDFNKRTLDLSSEIDSERNDHEFEYTFEGAGLSVDSLNQDKLLRPYGRQSVWTTAANGSGTLQIVLQHEPFWKSSSNRDLIDFDLTFPIAIQ